jgi:nucleolar complex protein 3
VKKKFAKMVKSAKKPIKPKSRSKMTRGKKKPEPGKISKQEKKFHQKFKFNVPLKKNNSMYQKNKPKPKPKQKQSQPTSSMDMDIIEDEDNDESTLPLDMLSDEEYGVPDDEDEDQELESYERLPRSAFSNSNQQRPLLPIKTDRGQLIAQSVPIVDEEIPDDDEEEEQQQNEEEKPSEPSKPVSVVELIAERENKLTETKQTIVTLCDLIMKSPYEEISNLKQLRLLLNLGDPLISMTIRKLTMLSLVELFRDIVPGYRIRSLKEQTKDEDEDIKNSKNKKQSHKEKLSKDVKVIRHFEQTLLKHYQFFLHFLEQCAKKSLPENRPNKQKPIKNIESSKLNLGHLAIQCLCKLLTNLHHFNFRTNLLTVVVQYTASR